MRLLLVNPNTTSAMTERMATAARSVAGPDTEIVALTSAYGPPSIEGYYDEVFAIPPMIQVVVEAAKQGCDGVVVGCFDDTGVDALRSLLDAPVIGICQVAMQTAAIVAGCFSVVTTLSRSVPPLEALALRYGFERHCRRVRAAEVPVLDLEDAGCNARLKIEESVQQALDEDKAEAIILGCAGMVDLGRNLSEKFGVPVIEGVTAATKLIEGLYALGLKNSSKGGYAPPLAKTYGGGFSDFSPGRTG